MENWAWLNRGESWFRLAVSHSRASCPNTRYVNRCYLARDNI
jgi:hypothetical protein